jgi:hypothetical protein
MPEVARRHYVCYLATLAVEIIFARLKPHVNKTLTNSKNDVSC